MPRRRRPAEPSPAGITPSAVLFSETPKIGVRKIGVRVTFLKISLLNEIAIAGKVTLTPIFAVRAVAGEAEANSAACRAQKARIGLKTRSDRTREPCGPLRTCIA